MGRGLVGVEDSLKIEKLLELCFRLISIFLAGSDRENYLLEN